MTADLIRTTSRAIVQTSSDLVTWTDREWLTCDDFSDGAGPVVGHAVLRQVYGSLIPPGGYVETHVLPSPNVSPSGNLSLVGMLVRILVEDPAGTITRTQPYLGTTISGTISYINETVKYSAAWHGIIRDEDRSVSGDDPTSGVVTWTCAGIAAVLDQVYVTHAYVEQASQTRILGRPLPFNDPSHTLSGVHPSGLIVNGTSGIRAHRSAAGGVGGGIVMWTARQIADYLLAGFARPPVPHSAAPQGFLWTISDPLNALNYTPGRIDPTGKTVLDLILQLISQRRGLTWWVTVAGAVATINVSTGLATAIGSVPAATATATLDVTDAQAAGLADVVIDRDDSQVADVVHLYGERPWFSTLLTFTNAFSGVIKKGWTAGEETSWAANPMAYEWVWRRFVIDPAGQTFGSLGDNVLATASDSAHGASGLSGGTSNSLSTTYASQNFANDMERMLPNTVDGVFSAGYGARKPPTILINGVDYSEQFRISVADHPPTIIIDDGDYGLTMRALIATAGYTAQVKFGHRIGPVMQVSWNRDPAQWPCITPRMVSYRVDGIARWFDAQNTHTFVDGTSQLNAALDFARAWHEHPTYAVTWTQRGLCDVTAATRPGRLLTTVTTADRAIAVNSVIVRRHHRWDGKMWRTTYQTETVRRASGEDGDQPLL